MLSFAFLLSGSVQGVGLRLSGAKKAEELALTGWIKNNPDGTVSGVVQGEEISTQEFFEWLKNGEFASLIREVSKTQEQLDPALRSFEIRI